MNRTPVIPHLEQQADGTTRYRTEISHVLEPAFGRLRDDTETAAYLVGRRSFTFADAGHRAAAVCTALHEAGVEQGDPVALVAPPGPEWVGAAIGILAFGAVLTPIDHTCSDLARDQIAQSTGIRWSITTAALTMPGTDTISVPSPSAAHSPLELRGGGDAPAVILHTSGSTGPPKPVVLSHQNLVQSLLSFVDVFGCHSGDRTCIAVPLFHVTGLIDQFLQMLWLGGQCRLLPSYDTDAMLRSLVSDEVSVLFGVPALFSLLVRRPPRSELALRLAIYGGAPMGTETVRALVDLVPGVRPVQGYGMTEITSLATALPAEFALTAPDAVGTPSPITQLRLISEGGEDVSGTGVDALGEILLRGPHRTPGYWNRPDLTAVAVDDAGWLHSGDLGWLDDDGLLHWSARISQLINRGGEKISPQEIELALIDAPGVSEAIAFALPDEVLYQVPAAAVVAAPGATVREDVLHADLTKRLARSKRPVKVWIVDSFPLGPTGKVDVAAIVHGAASP